MTELPWDDAYAAACHEVGLTGTEVAAQRYRRAVNAAVAALRPHIEAEALRRAANDMELPAGSRAWLTVHADEIESGKLRPCGTCRRLAQWIDCPTGGWWAHLVHPTDNHDADVTA